MHPALPPSSAPMPPPGSPWGAWQRLSDQLHDFEHDSGLLCDCSMVLSPGTHAPDGVLGNAVADILQGLLSNVLQHAKASQVVIRISASASDFTLRVCDNGCGAPPSVFEGPHARGIAAMQAKAASFGGWLQIDSQLSAGTQVILSMPLFAPRQGAGSA